MGFLDRLNDNGVNPKFNSGVDNDASDVYANLNQLIIEFYHLPSDRSVSFKAYLTSWDDKFSSNYNSEDIFGRNDQIHTFQGTFREIGISWDVVAGSIQEAQENLGRVSLLAQFLYPAYKMEATSFTTGTGSPQVMQVGTMTKAPLIKVRFANLIVDSKGQLDSYNAKDSGLLVAMDGLQITSDLDVGVFDGEGVSTPKVLKLTTNLKVVHQHTLGWNNDSKTWLGEGAAAGYPYNTWGPGQSSSNTLTGIGGVSASNASTTGAAAAAGAGGASGAAGAGGASTPPAASGANPPAPPASEPSVEEAPDEPLPGQSVDVHPDQM